MCGLITYMKHVFRANYSDIDPRDDPFHPFTPDEWLQQTSTMLRTHLIQNLPDPHGPEPVTSGPISSSRPTGYSPAANELMGFRNGIKREIAAYPSLKDERYFDGFKRSLFILALTRITLDISIILLFTFYQPVFYATYDQNFPSESEERPGYWVGFGEHCGDAMTHKILDHDTQKIIYRSAVRPKKSSTPNHRLDHMEGRFLHLLSILKIKFPLGHHLDTQKVHHRNRRPLQSSSGPEMKRIHLDPSLCLPLTPVT